jgi:hypothetical protein
VALAHVYREAARRLGIDLVEKPVRTEAEVQEMLAQVRERKIDGIVQPSSVSLNIPGFLVEATAARAIPTMFESMFFVECGGLASYGPDDYASGWQAARLDLLSAPLFPPLLHVTYCYYNRFPTSIQHRYAKARRRKDGHCVGTAARGLIERLSRVP